MKDLINGQILTKNKYDNIFNLDISLKNLLRSHKFCHKQNLLLETELSIYCSVSIFELTHILENDKNNLEYRGE
jgi:hypothetical protein